LDAPHFIQVGEAPVFSGTGNGDLLCRCGHAFLIKGYTPRNFLAIRIKCFRCGAVTTTPGLSAGEILPLDAVVVEPRALPSITPSTVSRGDVLADQAAVEREYALTRPRDPPGEAMTLTAEAVEGTAADYDRLTGGRLAEQCAASPPPMEPRQGDYPFAWSLLRLRAQIAQPGWSWLTDNDDAMAAMHVAAMRHLLDCWGQHPLLDRLASSLATPGQFLRIATGFGLAKLLFDAGNRVGFTLPATDMQVHFSTGAGEPLSLAWRAPDALQWRDRDRRQPLVLRAAVAEALASSHGQVNTRNPGIVVLSASILLPDFDDALVESIHAVFRAMGRRHRGVAAIAVVMPKVFIVQRRDRVGFGYAFYPIRNPHFAGENPIRLGSAEDFDPSRGGLRV
jgi:hypothetical protein